LKRIKVLALVEAVVVSGPAKNLLRFGVDCRDLVDLSVVTFIRASRENFSEFSNNQFITTARSLGIPIHIIRETGPFDRSVLGGLRQVCELQDADIVQTHGLKSHFLVSLITKRRSRWIAFHHGYTNENLKARFYRVFDRWSLRRCDLVITVCSAFARILAARGVPRERIFVVPNSVNTEVGKPDVTQPEATIQIGQIPPGERIVIAVGRLSVEKGHRYLIDAVSRVLRDSPQLRFRVLIAGSGPADRKLKQQVSKSGLDQHVTFIGHCYDIKAVFSIADLFVLPSLSEGSPNALLESMAARVPIVATNVGGVSEHVTDGDSALLVPPGDSAALAKAMIQLLSDRSTATKFADTAFERARLNFSTAKHDQHILKIYDRVLDNQVE
jgi:glycosyltransferase involved in cell wall biosynthesis